jgi:hypothetical protein
MNHPLSEGDSAILPIPMWSARFIVLPLVLLSVVALAQDAALQKLQSRYTAAQIDDLRQNGHFKYEGLLLFYGRSFKVQEGLEFREPTEQEILAVNLHFHDTQRAQAEDVLVEDPAIGRRLLLFSRDRFEALVLNSLSEADRQAYLAYKASMSWPSSAKNTAP